MQFPDRQTDPKSRFAGDISQAPLVPIALALTLGIILDRFVAIPSLLSVSASLAALLVWIAVSRKTNHRYSVVYLWLASTALGSAYHYAQLFGVADNDVRHLASEEAKPTRLRGVV